MTNWGSSWGSGGAAAAHSGSQHPWNVAPPPGVLPAETRVNFSGGLSQQYAAPQNQTSAAAQEAIAAIAAILKQRQRDKIANQLMAMESAPPATAINPATGQPDEAYSKTIKDPELTRAMMARHLELRYPTQDNTVVPDRGGVEGLQVSDMIRKRLGDQENADLNRQILKARLNKMEHPVMRATAYRDPNANKSYVPGVGYVSNDLIYRTQNPSVTDDADDRAQQRLYEKQFGALTKDLSSYGLRPEDLDALDIATAYKSDTETPGAVKFVDEQGLPVSTEDAQADPGSYYAVGKAGAKAFRIPFGKYQEVLGKNGALPDKPERAHRGAAVDPLVQRAQQALADPNASPEAKAAAQRALARYGQ